MEIAACSDFCQPPAWSFAHSACKTGFCLVLEKSGIFTYSRKCKKKKKSGLFCAVCAHQILCLLVRLSHSNVLCFKVKVFKRKGSYFIQ